MRRRWLIGAAIVACAGVLEATMVLRDRPGVTAANVARIQEGMTLEQVEAIMGGPGWPLPCGGLRSWAGDNGIATVHFTVEELGRVIKADFSPHDRTIFDRFRAWLGW